MERISDIERAYVLEVLSSQFRSSTSSSMTGRLEEKFAEMFGCKYAISFINGTATMHATLAAAGIGKGDEVIVPPLTMASTSFAVLHTGALPVFADIDPYTWTIDPKSIEACITDRTKAIIPVSIYGLAPDLDEIMKIADINNLFVLEDDAQCFLGKYKGKLVGKVGHAASFSFQSSKHMTSGEGGMIITDDEHLANEIRRFNSLGYASVGAGAGKGKISKDIIQDPKYERHIAVGWNYRLPELCAAVALGQLERLNELVGMRIKAANSYADILKLIDCNWLIPQLVPDDLVHSYWTYVLRLNQDAKCNWNDFRSKYIEYGGDGIYSAWQLTYLEPALKGKKFSKFQTQLFELGLCPVAESIRPFLLQLKTNYFDESIIQEKCRALMKTISYFS